jgi:ABC-type transporter Mla subunit MlaD
MPAIASTVDIVTLLLYKASMREPNHPQPYDFDTFERISEKNTEQRLLDALADTSSQVVPKDIIAQYLADLAKEMDSTQEDNNDLLRKKTEIFYQALKMLDEVIDFLSSDLSDLLSPDYPERADELREKLRSATDKLEEENSRLDNPADVEDIDRLL